MTHSARKSPSPNRDGLHLVAFWIGAALVLGTVANGLAVLRLCAGGGASLF